jgi:hypothetical protein
MALKNANWVWGLQGPNIVNAHVPDTTIKFLFGDEPVTRMPVDQLDWAEVAVAAGFFPSKTQARKNGWEGLIPFGIGQRGFGKHKGVWFFSKEPPSQSVPDDEP